MKTKVVIKKIMMVALFLTYAFIFSSTHAQNSTAKPKTMETQSKTDIDLAQLSALNARFIKNWVTSDTVSHNQIIHKDFVYISMAGKIVDRDTYMKNWAQGYNPEIDKSFEYKNEVIRIFGNMALVRSNTYYSWLENGKLMSGKTVYTDTYIKENGRWWCVQAQITELK